MLYGLSHMIDVLPWSGPGISPCPPRAPFPFTAPHPSLCIWRWGHWAPSAPFYFLLSSWLSRCNSSVILWKASLFIWELIELSKPLIKDSTLIMWYYHWCHYHYILLLLYITWYHCVPLHHIIIWISYFMFLDYKLHEDTDCVLLNSVLLNSSQTRGLVLSLNIYHNFFKKLFYLHFFLDIFRRECINYFMSFYLLKLWYKSLISDYYLQTRDVVTPLKMLLLRSTKILECQEESGDKVLLGTNLSNKNDASAI